MTPPVTLYRGGILPADVFTIIIRKDKQSVYDEQACAKGYRAALFLHIKQRRSNASPLHIVISTVYLQIVYRFASPTELSIFLSVVIISVSRQDITDKTTETTVLRMKLFISASLYELIRSVCRVNGLYLSISSACKSAELS